QALAANDKAQGEATQPPETSDVKPAQTGDQSDSIERDANGELAGNVMLAKPVLDETLKERFPNPGERTAFVNRAVEIAEGTLARAWALRRLRDRYAPEEVARLSSESRRKLELLIRDDTSALRQYVSDARSFISPVLQSQAVTAQSLDAQPSTL